MASKAADGHRIAILLEKCPRRAERYIGEEIEGLERLGQRLHVFTLARPMDADPEKTAVPLCAPVSHVPGSGPGNLGTLLRAHLTLAATLPLRYAAALRWALGRRRGFADFLRAGWLVHRMRREGIAHLHAHLISRPADVAELAGRLGVPFSVSAHAEDIWLSDPADLRRKLEAARFTIAGSDYARRTLAACAPRATIYRMYQGVDRERFHPRLRERLLGAPLILAVGRLQAKKGFDVLIEACRILAQRHVRFRCDIVGDGEEYLALERRVDDAGLFGVVVLTGRLAHEAVMERYACASVLVQPSRIGRDGDRDDIPRVLLEAMSTEIPVVASRVSAIPELVRHEETGLLVAPDSPQELAEAIRRLLADKHLRQRLGKAGRSAVAAGFDPDRNLRLLDRLLEKHHDHTVAAGAPLRA